MARVIGIDIPDNKRLEFSLRYIYGVGPAIARRVCVKLNLDPEHESPAFNGR